VKVTAAGETQSQKILVVKDPNTPATVADAIASSTRSYKIYVDTDRSVHLINQIEWSRKQLEDTRRLLVAKQAEKNLLDATDALNNKYLDREHQLLHPTIAEGDEKSFRGPLGLYLKFIWLGAEVGTGGGDVAGNSDFAPTEPEKQVFALLDGQLQAVEMAVKQIDQQELPAYNSVLEKAGVSRITVVPDGGPSQEEDSKPPAKDSDD
jgi:hypothetical protein